MFNAAQGGSIAGPTCSTSFPWRQRLWPARKHSKPVVRNTVPGPYATTCAGVSASRRSSLPFTRSSPSCSMFSEARNHSKRKDCLCHDSSWPTWEAVLSRVASLVCCGLSLAGGSVRRSSVWLWRYRCASEWAWRYGACQALGTATCGEESSRPRCFSGASGERIAGRSSSIACARVRSSPRGLPHQMAPGKPPGAICHRPSGPPRRRYVEPVQETGTGTAHSGLGVARTRTARRSHRAVRLSSFNCRLAVPGSPTSFLPPTLPPLPPPLPSPSSACSPASRLAAARSRTPRPTSPRNGR